MKRLALAAAVVLVTVGMPAPALAAPGAVGVCTVTARLDWGFKESFRAYIDGSIANGSWQASDGATYETPLFLFPGEGELTSDQRLSLDFRGSVNFTGHGGILDTTIANPILRIGPDGAMLFLDVSGDTMEGEAFDETAVPFVEVDLGGQDLREAGGVITIAEAPTRLTAEGSAAFPNYPEGEAFDPVSVTVDASACDDPQLATGDPSTPELPAILTVSGVLLVIATVVAAIRLRRREPGGPGGGGSGVA